MYGNAVQSQFLADSILICSWVHERDKAEKQQVWNKIMGLYDSSSPVGNLAFTLNVEIFCVDFVGVLVVFWCW